MCWDISCEACEIFVMDSAILKVIWREQYIRYLTGSYRHKVLKIEIS